MALISINRAQSLAKPIAKPTPNTAHNSIYHNRIGLEMNAKPTPETHLREIGRRAIPAALGRSQSCLDKCGCNRSRMS
jgi:hypothetical protein